MTRDDVTMGNWEIEYLNGNISWITRNAKGDISTRPFDNLEMRLYHMVILAVKTGKYPCKIIVTSKDPNDTTEWDH